MREGQIERLYIGSRFGKVFEPDSWHPSVPTHRCPQVYKEAVQEWRLGKRAENPRSIQQREDWERYNGPLGETEYRENQDRRDAIIAARMRGDRRSPEEINVQAQALSESIAEALLFARASRPPRRSVLIPIIGAPRPYNPEDLLNA